MRPFAILLLIVTSLSCRSGKEQVHQQEATSDKLVHVILHCSVSENRLGTILWQRGYPDEYAQLIKEAEASRSGNGIDPFAPPIRTPNRDLIPLGFHDRPPIIPTIFTRLGWPLPEGGEAIYRSNAGIIEITHKREAITEFMDNFPELTENNKKANKSEQATPRKPSD